MGLSIHQVLWGPEEALSLQFSETADFRLQVTGKGSEGLAVSWHLLSKVFSSPFLLAFPSVISTYS